MGREVGGGGEALAVLASLLSESLLVAADKPDTRFWIFQKKLSEETSDPGKG